MIYYFCLRFGDIQYPLAMITLFSEPDEDTLSESSGTVHLCDQDVGIAVVPITSVHSVVAMFPNMQVDTLGHISLTGRYSLMQHPYIDVAQFTGNLSFSEEGDREHQQTLDATIVLHSTTIVPECL